MQEKTKKQQEIFLLEDFTTKINTFNNKVPKCIFTEIKSWIKPNVEYDFERLPQQLEKKIKQQIYNKLNKDLFKEKFILDFDLRSSGLKKNKLSFLKINLSLFPNTLLPFLNENHREEIEKLIKEIIIILKEKDINYYGRKQYGLSDNK